MQIVNHVRIIRNFAFLLLAYFVYVLFSIAYAQSGDVEVRLEDDATVQRLAEGVWLHTTYFDISGYKHVPANGLIIIDGEHAMMIDLPWTDAQAGILFDWVAHERPEVFILGGPQSLSENYPVRRLTR